MQFSLLIVFAVFPLNARNPNDLVDDDNFVSHPHEISDLSPKMDGKNVSVKFTVTGTYGIAQIFVPGQSPSFGIRTEDKRLTVRIKGELANVFDRFQMSYLQANQLKKGTTLVATGKLIMEAEQGLDIGILDKEGKPTVWKRIKGQEKYILYLKDWKEFRILKRSKSKKKQ